MEIKINHKDGKESIIYLIGTAHISENSVFEVENTILSKNPDAICIELDEDRFRKMVGLNNTEYEKSPNILELIKNGDLGLYIIHHTLGSFQKELGDKLGINPGSEMKRAFEISKILDKPIYLIDRPVNITLKRVINSLTLKEKIKLIMEIFDDNKEGMELNEHTIREMVGNAELFMEILKEQSPTIYNVLVDERDRFMAKNLFEISKSYDKVVAVVGAGHVKGIGNYLKKLENNEIDIDIKELLKIKRGRNYLKYIFSSIILLIIGYGIYSISSNPEALKKFTIDWILINGGLSALGAFIGRGKIQSIIAAFLAAPITSLIPIIGAGYVVGLVELKYRNVSLEDIEKLIYGENLRDFLNNNAMRVLIVATLSSLGSMIGTLYFIPYFFK